MSQRPLQVPKPIAPSRTNSRELPKAPTGIHGLDSITGGGLPQGRPTLICGSAGCGKTLLAMEFLVRGAMHYGEPGVFLAFEETPDDLIKNVRSLGFDLDHLIAQKKVVIDYIHIEAQEIQETGEYDLGGLFVRLGLAIDEIGAKRVVIDTIETLFGGLSNQGILRAELRRLFRWLKDRGVTAIITGERGERQLTRHGLEEYVSDCVILLDHRVTDQVSTRHLRIVKYRGTVHGTNEYPFLIDEAGISVLPTTSMRLDHPASTERITSGVPRLDSLLGGEGYFRGASVLISGTAGTGKSSLGAAFADATCRRGERCLYLSFEESPPQLIRNMRSIGFDLERWIKKKVLLIRASRPTFQGLEAHLVSIYKLAAQFEPSTVVVDPVSSFSAAGSPLDVHLTVMRMVDFFKTRGITTVFINLAPDNTQAEHTDLEVSSLIDTWLLLRNLEFDGERNRGIFVLKSRGMAHSNEIREFVLSDSGIQLLDVYRGPEGVLTGSARLAQDARERSARLEREHEASRRNREFQRKRQKLEGQIARLRLELEGVTEEARVAAAADR